MNTDKIYIPVLEDLVNWLIPNKIKQPRFYNWIKSLITPFAVMRKTFQKFRKAKLYELHITPQVCFLEKMLNDRFDFTARRIYIDDGIDRSPLYIFKRDEVKPKYISKKIEDKPVYIYTRGESGLIKDDFVVFVAMPIVFDMNEMASLIKVYKLAGTKFKIQRI